MSVSAGCHCAGSEGLTPSLTHPRAFDARERLAAFWERSPADAPLSASIRNLGGAHAHATSGHGRRLTPDDVLAGAERGLDAATERLARCGILDGDLFRPLTIPGEPPWMLAILGCELSVPREHGHGAWVKPLAGGLDELIMRARNPEQAWLDALGACLGMLSAQAGQQYPVAAWHGRGPVDLLAQALGPQAFALAVVDQPGAVGEALDRVTELWIDVAARALGAVPRHADGTFHRYGLWAPGSLVAFTTDAATMVSPVLYRDTFLRWDRRMVSAFDHVLVHTHSGAHAHYASWAELEGAAIQVVDDPGTACSWPRLVEQCTTLQHIGHPLYLQAEVAHLTSARDALDARGLILRGYK